MLLDVVNCEVPHWLLSMFSSYMACFFVTILHQYFVSLGFFPPKLKPGTSHNLIPIPCHLSWASRPPLFFSSIMANDWYRILLCTSIRSLTYYSYPRKNRNVSTFLSFKLAHSRSQSCHMSKVMSNDPHNILVILFMENQIRLHYFLTIQRIPLFKVVLGHNMMPSPNLI